jgi:hypothetical protein
VSSNQLPPVPLQSPVLSPNGFMTMPWAAFFRELYNRIGGSGTAGILLDTLPAGEVFIGDASGVASPQSVTGDVTISSAGVTSITPGVIVDADINSAAAVAYSKLNLAISILNADISPSAAIAGDKIVAATGSVPGVVSTTTQTFAGAKTFSGALSLSSTLGVAGAITATGGIVGSDGTADATSGNVGQYVSSSVSALSSGAGSGVWNDMTSISLTAGDWDISAIASWHANSASGITRCAMGISTTSGNSSSGMTQGNNLCELPTAPTSAADVTLTVPAYRVRVSATTTYYLKNTMTYSAGTPQYQGRISARRVR